jgi:hypothetical protein|nr:MAG TPA: hypothetical protein [Caudoviricetes sp.]
MTTFVSNRDSGGKTNENGHFRILSEILAGEVIRGFEVTARTSPSMVLNISQGAALVPYSNYSYGVWSDAIEQIIIPGADSSNSRIDSIVAYVDRTMNFNSADINNPGALKFKVVSGSASNNPVPPTQSQVQASIGAGNPYIILANVTVNQGVSAILASAIDNKAKKPAKLSDNIASAGFLTSRDSKIEFDLIQEGDSLPSAKPGKTLIVFITERN